ncbi:MAG: PLP-dependent transferase [Nitrososphaerota archaeon]|nr:PLP-dependent transferase [Nitrososphaerota archaeon]
MRFATKAVRYGNEPDKATGAVSPPIVTASTFAQEGVAKPRGYEYSRSGNPTRERLERAVAGLEGARHGLAFSSGLGAITTVASLLGKGDHVIVCNDVYGGTFRLFSRVFSNFGVTFTRVDARDPDAVSRARRARTKMVWLESPTNPLMVVLDIRAVSRSAKKDGLMVVVDNTFASPYLQNPLKLGATISLHSTTKYVSGHSDMIGGALAVSDEGVYERLKFLQNAMGAVPGPFDCYLALRGLRTLHLRMDQHSKNAQAIAELLQSDRRVSEVFYPYLADSPTYSIARRQMSQGGGMLSFRVRGGYKAAERFLESLRLFSIAESLGGVESLAEHPGRMTHSSLPEKERRAMGITDDLIRLSVGVEDAQDLLDDVRKALESI